MQLSVVFLCDNQEQLGNKRQGEPGRFHTPEKNAGRVAPGAQVSSEEDLGRQSCGSDTDQAGAGGA